MGKTDLWMNTEVREAGQQENERKDRKANDRKDSGGRRVKASGHCQPEDP